MLGRRMMHDVQQQKTTAGASPNQINGGMKSSPRRGPGWLRSMRNLTRTYDADTPVRNGVFARGQDRGRRSGNHPNNNNSSGNNNNSSGNNNNSSGNNNNSSGNNNNSSSSNNNHVPVQQRPTSPPIGTKPNSQTQNPSDRVESPSGAILNIKNSKSIGSTHDQMPSAPRSPGDGAGGRGGRIYKKQSSTEELLSFSSPRSALSADDYERLIRQKEELMMRPTSTSAKVTRSMAPQPVVVPLSTRNGLGTTYEDDRRGQWDSESRQIPSTIEANRRYFMRKGHSVKSIGSALSELSIDSNDEPRQMMKIMNSSNRHLRQEEGIRIAPNSARIAPSSNKDFPSRNAGVDASWATSNPVVKPDGSPMTLNAQRMMMMMMLSQRGGSHRLTQYGASNQSMDSSSSESVWTCRDPMSSFRYKHAVVMPETYLKPAPSDGTPISDLKAQYMSSNYQHLNLMFQRSASFRSYGSGRVLRSEGGHDNISVGRSPTLSRMTSGTSAVSQQDKDWTLKHTSSAVSPLAATSATALSARAMMHRSQSCHSIGSSGRDSQYSSQHGANCHVPANAKEEYGTIELSPGHHVRLRGAKETMDCIERDFYTPLSCMGCTMELCCILDADYVLCPVCRVISPMDDGNNSKQGVGGVGLGFTFDDLSRWQGEIMLQRQGQRLVS